MTGSSDYLPVMADCERALGRPQQALRLIKEAAGQPMDPASSIELRIVEAGARHDQGQTPEAARLLRATIAGLGRQSADPAMREPVARLHYALADVLLDLDDPNGARQAFTRAADLDDDGATDAQERLDQLNGLQITFDDDEYEDSDDESDDVESDDVESDEVESDEVESDEVDADAVGAATDDEATEADGELTEVESDTEPIDSDQDEVDQDEVDQEQADQSVVPVEDTSDVGTPDEGDPRAD